MSPIPPIASAIPAATPARLREAFGLCVAKTRRNIEMLAEAPATWAFDAAGRYPRWREGFYEIGNWTSSFFTGMALLAWRESQDDHLLRQLDRLEPWYQAKVGEHAAETMHDLGFLYSLYSVALHKLVGGERHRDLGIKAAEVLAARFIPEGGYIRAWGRMDEPDTDYAGLAIVDCMMNLPLLYWAAEETGEERFREIAIRHSDMTLERFIREDGSVCHAYRFDPRTGAPLREDNYCGRAVGSHWARGASWAAYGFAMGHRYTGDRRYLDASLKVIRAVVSNLDAEAVPLWDFRLDSEAPRLRDSSSAAVAACAIQELDALDAADEPLLAAKRALIARLCSEDYLDFDLGIEGILRYGQVGAGVGRARSAYTSWGDYYFMEALARESGMTETWW